MNHRHGMGCALGLGLAVLVAGCASTLQPLGMMTAWPGAVSVRVKDARKGHVALEVRNDSPRTLVVMRDNLRLVDSRGVHPRLPGGLQSVYYLPPGGVHGLNAAFDIRHIQHGDVAQLRFDGVFLIGERPVMLPPLDFTAR